MRKPLENYNGFNITFQVTEDCNLRCVYCYEVQKQPHDLPLLYAERFIELILDDPDPVGILHTDKAWIYQGGAILDFIGGDALLRPELCEACIRYFQFYAIQKRHRWGERFRANISTNGTLFHDPKVREFMTRYKKNLSVGVSIDGCPPIHDRNRKTRSGEGSMQALCAWWPWYREWKDGPLATKATLNKESIPYMRESVEYLHEAMGISYIHMNFIFEDMRLDNHDLEEIDRQLAQIARYVLRHRHDLYLSLLRKEHAEGRPTHAIDPDTTWCGAGAMPCIVPSGKIYPCFRFTPITMSSPDIPDLSCGDIWNGFHKKDVLHTIRSQTRRKISPPECVTCDCETWCAWCIAGTYAETGTFTRSTHLCRIQPVIAKWSDWYWKQFYDYEKNTNGGTP